MLATLIDASFNSAEWVFDVARRPPLTPHRHPPDPGETRNR
jgi:hypothetical protein